MAKTYTVRQGDCLSSIAQKHGFTSWKTIYYHSENAGFRRMRPNPNQLYPGDGIFIPDVDSKHEDRPTDKRHTFVVDRPVTRVRIRIEDGERHPAARKKYVLDIEGGVKREGITDPDGLIECEVPAEAENGRLTVWVNESDKVGISWTLKLGHLDPLDEVTGAQGRLRNLGLYHGPVDGELTEETRAALQAFQHRAGVEPSGNIDDATRDTLRELHDNNSRRS